MSAEQWKLQPLVHPLDSIITELRGLARGGLEEEKEGEQQEIKGLKFISNKLARLFDRNRKLKYSHVSKILIENFSSETNDSRNIKRRVYDAINVMVAAGLFEKTGDILQKKERNNYRERIDFLKSELNSEYIHQQNSVNTKRDAIAKLAKRRVNLQRLIERNKMRNQASHAISTPILINLRDGIKVVSVSDGAGAKLCQIDMKKTSKSKSRSASEVMKQQEYLEYL